MKIVNRIQWCGVVLLAFSLASCKVERPEAVFSDAKMEDVLYDYHIAKAMGEEVVYNESYKRVLYIESVLKKHGVTQGDFDSSMVWFTRNPDVLAKVYEKVNLRLKAERDGINHLIALRDNRPKVSLPGDSIDVWTGQRIYRLTGMPLSNKIVFELSSDSNFHDRDTLRWSVRFRFPGGEPDSVGAPLMAMQVLYEKNDSVVGEMRKVPGAGVETITLCADTLGEIKEIRGFVYYPRQEAARLLLAEGVALMRYHATDSLSVAPKDSLGQETDSLKSVGRREKLKPQKVEEPKRVALPQVARPRPKA